MPPFTMSTRNTPRNDKEKDTDEAVKAAKDQAMSEVEENVDEDTRSVDKSVEQEGLAESLAQEEEKEDDLESDKEDVEEDAEDPILSTPPSPIAFVDESAKAAEFDTEFADTGLTYGAEPYPTVHATHPGMPIVLTKAPPTKQEVFKNARGDLCQFNELKNLFGLTLLSGLMTGVRAHMTATATIEGKLVKTNQRKPFDQVVTTVVTDLLEKAGCEEVNLTMRHLNVYWKVFCGFGKNTLVNVELQLILHFFALIRLGVIGFEGMFTEHAAAMFACNLYYRATCKDNKGGVKESDTGWSIGLLHLLNGHLIHRGFTPITMGITETAHEALIALTKTFNTMKWHDGKPYYVESRPGVIANLKSFILPRDTVWTRIKGHAEELIHDDKVVYASDEGQPGTAAPTTGGPQKKKIRLSIPTRDG